MAPKCGHNNKGPLARDGRRATKASTSALTAAAIQSFRSQGEAQTLPGRPRDEGDLAAAVLAGETCHFFGDSVCFSPAGFSASLGVSPTGFSASVGASPAGFSASVGVSAAGVPAAGVGAVMMRA